MSDNKKYYYLKLKDNFFDTEAMILLESMPDGHLYSNILLKLYLRSLKSEGKLMYNDRIPYNENMIGQITRHSDSVVKIALKAFSDLDLIEILDNGAIYMTDIQNFIGQSSNEADRKRLYRARIDQEKVMLPMQNGQTSDKCPDKSPPKIEIEKELEIELENKDNQISFDGSVQIKSDDTKELYEYYNTIGLIKHKKLTDSMVKSAKKALKDYQLEELKVMLDRHKKVVEHTEDNRQYAVRKRSFAEFFGQKVKDGMQLICEEYADGGAKWEYYKGVLNGESDRQGSNEFGELLQGFGKREHEDVGDIDCF